MKKSEFVWGATMDKMMMNGEVSNITQVTLNLYSRGYVFIQWFDLFNLGVARNEFKWEHIYR